MTEQFRPQPENPKQHAPEAGAGSLGLPPPGSEQSPQGEGSKSPERQPRPRIVFNPRKETLEEFKKRYQLAWKQRDLEWNSDEQREKRRKYNTEYKRRWRQARKQQHEEGLTQQEQE
jgi:hypothetical protein